MKQLLLYGSTGNNVCVIQIPTNWSVDEAREFLEKALLEFAANKQHNEFFSISNEDELNQKWPKKSSEIEECCKIILNNIGSPINGAGGLIWQVRLQSYIMTNPDFINRLFKAFEKKLTREEEAFLSANYLELLPTLVKTIKNSL